MALRSGSVPWPPLSGFAITLIGYTTFGRNVVYPTWTSKSTLWDIKVSIYIHKQCAKGVTFVRELA